MYIPTVFFAALPVIVGPSKLMCSHDNYLVAGDPNESTVFCKLQGQPNNFFKFCGLTYSTRESQAMLSDVKIL